MAYASAHGVCTRWWTGRSTCRGAGLRLPVGGPPTGVPEHVRFATVITLARRMLARILDADAPPAWATADESYGGDTRLRRDLQGHRVGHVLAVARS
jgi:hypothetical protein